MGITFRCRHCYFSTPKFKELIDHYNASHNGRLLKRYQIKHKPTGNSAITGAPSAQEACEANGWLIGDCTVKELRQ